MKTLEDLFKNLRRLDLSQMEVQDSLYRISDWLSDEEHTAEDDYVKNQLNFLSKLVSSAEQQDKIFFANKNKAEDRIEGHIDDILEKIGELKDKNLLEKFIEVHDKNL